LILEEGLLKCNIIVFIIFMFKLIKIIIILLFLSSVFIFSKNIVLAEVDYPKCCDNSMVSNECCKAQNFSCCSGYDAFSKCQEAFPSNCEKLTSASSNLFGLDDLAERVGLKRGDMSARDIIMRSVQTILSFTSILAVIMVIYGGFTWTTAAGSSERVQKGKKILLWSAIGLIIVTSAWALVSYVIYLSSQLTGG